MTNIIQYIYVGVRLDEGNKKRYAYINKEDGPKGNIDLYSSKLLGYENVGTIIECERTDNGVKAPYKPLGKIGEEDWNEFITEWSVMERANLEHLKAISAAKKDHSNSVTQLVKQLKESVDWKLSKSQKESFALWVYKELIK